MSNERREVYAGHGYRRAMGYKYRARIQCRKRFLRKSLKYRAVIEEFFMAWNDERYGRWCLSKEEAIRDANAILDRIEAKPRGEYV